MNSSQTSKNAKQDLFDSNSQMLDEIIEKLVNYDKYEKFTIEEEKGKAYGNLPYILKEKEIRMLIASAEIVF